MRAWKPKFRWSPLLNDMASSCLGVLNLHFTRRTGVRQAGPSPDTVRAGSSAFEAPQFLEQLRQFATYALGLVWFSRALSYQVNFIIRNSNKMQVSHVSSSSTVVPKFAARHATQVSAKRVVAAAAKASPQTSDDKIQLGKSGLEVPSIGIGAWSWGDRSGYWGWNKEYGINENRAAFDKLLAEGMTLIDTAEVYGFGKSEELIAEFSKSSSAQPVIATKFAPLPWRFQAGNVENALKDSLSRLKATKVGLYQIHWPGFPFINNWSTDAFVEGMARVQRQGLADAVGVSNFNAKRLRRSHSIMQGSGVPLASDQVQYSLLYREPERNGVLDTCRELGITLIAYSPMCQGLLTGKYTPSNRPGGARGGLITEERARAVQPLLALMKDIGQANGGKTCAQVAINWCMCKGTLPIPGAKNAQQAAELAGAMGWRMSDDQVSALDKESDKVTVSAQGAPFEQW